MAFSFCFFAFRIIRQLRLVLTKSSSRRFLSLRVFFSLLSLSLCMEGLVCRGFGGVLHPVLVSLHFQAELTQCRAVPGM